MSQKAQEPKIPKSPKRPKRLKWPKSYEYKIVPKAPKGPQNTKIQSPKPQITQKVTIAKIYQIKAIKPKYPKR